MADFLNFDAHKSMNEADLDRAKIDAVKQLVARAGLHGGHIFGGYLRSMIQSKWAPLDITWKDVDFWFRTQAKADLFVTAAKDILVRSEGIGYAHELGEQGYPFARQQYNLRIGGVTLAYVDVIVAADYPVNDFDVNTLSVLKLGLSTWEWRQFGLKITTHSGLHLIHKIELKEAQMLPSYVESFTSGPPWRMYHHAQRVSARYLAQGWKIYMPDGTPLAPNADRAAGVLAFIRGWARTQPVAIPSAGPSSQVSQASTKTSAPTAGPSSQISQAPTDTSTPGSNIVGISTAYDSIKLPALAQMVQELTDAIERKHVAAIINLMAEIQAVANRGPPTLIPESFKPRAQALVAETRQDLLKILAVVQAYQELLGPK